MIDESGLAEINRELDAKRIAVQARLAALG
jgi:hypothetical protein